MTSGDAVLGLLLATGLAAPSSQAQTPRAAGSPVAAPFGAPILTPYGFCGRIYEMPGPHPDTSWISPPLTPPAQGRVPPAIVAPNCAARLPDFEALKPIGRIYTTTLNVPVRDFREGFPGVTGRIEWFAIDYTTRFWIEKPGKYSFLLDSDDGSILYVDGRKVIDNDCVHPTTVATGAARLEGGIHEMRVSYFQGPPVQVALRLFIKPPGEKARIFNTDEFRPPANPADWKYPNPDNLDAPEDPCRAVPHTTRKLLHR